MAVAVDKMDICHGFWKVIQQNENLFSKQTIRIRR